MIMVVEHAEGKAGEYRNRETWWKEGVRKGDWRGVKERGRGTEDGRWTVCAGRNKSKHYR